MDEVRIYNRALSASEIVSDRDTPLGGSSPTATPVPPTSTPLPATATATRTPTSVPPTSTPLPATATPTATPGTGALIQDSFTRSVSTSWGSADLGGSYATPASNSADYSVTNGMGQLNLPAASTSREQVLNGAGAPSAQDAEIQLAVAADTIPTGSTELRLGAIARQVSSGNLYRAVTRFIPGGSVKLQAQKVVAGTESWLGTRVIVSGLTVTAGSRVRVRIQVTGANPTTIRMRAWADGSSEPSTWQYTTTESTATALQTAGTFGLRAQLTSGATNAPIVARFDDWLVSTSLSAAAPTREQRADVGAGVRAETGATSHQPPATSVEAAVSSMPPRTQASLPNPDSPIFTSFGKALLRQLQQSIPTTTRTISYGYDGLQRLTSAIENPGTNQTYSYDLAGNRTGVWVNGTRTQNLTYNAANQVSGWSYDAAGNLLSDGTTASTYDALNRVLSTGSTSNQYNADGTLVAQTVSGVTTRSTQDVAAPLSQILSNGTQRYVYGNPAERLFAQQGSSARTWYSVDALGSVRATLSDAGIPQAVASYDAWGVPETPSIASFGFTGELQQGSDVWLRARWYGAGRGGFTARDPYEGDAQTPYSMMPYQYAYAAPTVWTDPSGNNPEVWEFVKSLEPFIKKAARMHQRPLAGFHFDVMVATMGAIVFEENKGGADSYRQRIRGDLGRSIPLLNPPDDSHNPSTGPAQMRPWTAIDIYNGHIRGPDGRIIGWHCYHLPSLDHLPYWFKQSFDLAGKDSFYRNDGQDRMAFGGILQLPEVSMDFLGATIEMSIDRARLLNIVPSIYSAASWHNRGQQFKPGMDLHNPSYGFWVLSFIDTAAAVLNVSAPHNAIRSNHAERQRYPILDSLDRSPRRNVQ